MQHKLKVNNGLYLTVDKWRDSCSYAGCERYASRIGLCKAGTLGLKWDRARGRGQWWKAGWFVVEQGTKAGRWQTAGWLFREWSEANWVDTRWGRSPEKKSEWISVPGKPEQERVRSRQAQVIRQEPTGLSCMQNDNIQFGSVWLWTWGLILWLMRMWLQVWLIRREGGAD